MLRGVGQRDQRTTVLGTPVSFPVLVPPMGFHGLCHADAELATARGTAAADTIFVASTVSNRSLEAIAEACTGPRWFQLYVYRDKAITRDLVQRAAAAGYSALCLTVDTPLAGQRERDRRNRLRMPPHLGLDNFPAAHAERHKAGDESGSSLARYIADMWDANLTWDDVDWLRSISPLPVIIKGVLAPEDAALAVEHGADGGHRVESWRSPARWRTGTDHRTSPHRRRRWRPHRGPARWRRSPRDRRAQGARPRRARGARRPAGALGAHTGRRGGRRRRPRAPPWGDRSRDGARRLPRRSTISTPRS